ncbi:MAG: hypothetical protein JW849_06150 [Phycisphaerae bacterium]|nr:hypothetical protein [Phycisphaerae bacterium]
MREKNQDFAANKTNQNEQKEYIEEFTANEREQSEQENSIIFSCSFWFVLFAANFLIFFVPFGLIRGKFLFFSTLCEKSSQFSLGGATIPVS